MGNLEQLVDWLRDFFLDWRSWVYICAAGFGVGVAQFILDELRWRRQRKRIEQRNLEQRKHDERREREWRSRIERQWRDDHRQRSRERDEPDGGLVDPRGPGRGRERF